MVMIIGIAVVCLPSGSRRQLSQAVHAGIAQPVPLTLVAAQPLPLINDDAAQPPPLMNAACAQRGGDRLAACPCCLSQARRRPHPAKPAS